MKLSSESAILGAVLGACIEITYQDNTLQIDVDLGVSLNITITSVQACIDATISSFTNALTFTPSHQYSSLFGG